MKEEIVELKDVVPVLLPQRSRLYHLEPVRSTNGLGESLTSYIARLAAAHCLPLSALVTRELSPLFRRKSITQPDGHCDLLGKFGVSVNGNNNTAQESVLGIEQLTGQIGLSELTMLVAGDSLAATPLLRPTQAWCPHCLDEWLDQQSLFYPLMWSLVAVRGCPFHRIQLVNRCSRCKRSHLPLSRGARIGRCPWCESWLGVAADKCKVAGCRPAQATEWECYAAEATAKLLTELATAKQRRGNENVMFAKNVSAIVEHSFDGSMNALAKFLNCHHGTICDWATRLRRPSLNSVLVVAFRLNVSPSILLLGSWDSTTSSSLRPTGPAHDARLRPALRTTTPEKIERTLRAAVDKNLWPPPSLRQVCLRAGFHQTQATLKFPELSRKIMEIHRSYRYERRCRGEQLLRKAIRAVVNELHAVGVYPSNRKMRTKLVRGVFLRHPIAIAEREAAMRDLGLTVRSRGG